MRSKRIATNDQKANVMLDERFQKLLEVSVQIHKPTRDVPDEVLRRRRCVLRWVASTSNAKVHRDHRSPSSSRLARPMSRSHPTFEVCSWAGRRSGIELVSIHVCLHFPIRNELPWFDQSRGNPLHEFEPISKRVVGIAAVETFEWLINSHRDSVIVEG